MNVWCVGVWLQGCMVVREWARARVRVRVGLLVVYGCMGVLVYGCMGGLSVYGCKDGGCVGVWWQGCMVVRLWAMGPRFLVAYGCMDVWMYGCMDVWVYGCIGVWL